MSARDRLYLKSNNIVQKTLSIEEGLDSKIKRLTETKYDATVSELINICIEEFLDKKKTKFYGKPANEITIYRCLMLRKDNIEGINKKVNSEGISFTRLVNIAIKDFLDSM